MLEQTLASLDPLRGRSFLKELDLAPAEWTDLTRLALELKAARRAGREPRLLEGRTIALIFEKASTRTRCAFEVAAYHQGAHVTVLDPSGSQIGHKESIADTARVLGRMFDGIEFRGSAHADVEELAVRAGVPVFNGLTDDWHPTQSLCDAMTMVEHCRGGSLEAASADPIRFAYVGDARSNMGNSLLVLGALTGADVRIVAPRSLWPSEDVQSRAREAAGTTGARITVTDDLDAGVAGVEVIHTDVWVSMGEPKEVWAERIELLAPYRVTRELLERTGVPGVRFMHCLPAFHDLGTAVGRQVHEQFGIREMEVTDEVFASDASIVFDQAENRLHSIKAVLVAALANPTQA